MRVLLILTALFATALAAPFIPSPEILYSLTWQPAPGTATSCNKTTDKIIGFYQGPQMETVLTNACVAMMPACAFPDQLAEDIYCIQVMDWPLDGPKNSTQNANVQTSEGNKISGWDVKCQLSVHPCVYGLC